MWSSLSMLWNICSVKKSYNVKRDEKKCRAYTQEEITDLHPPGSVNDIKTDFVPRTLVRPELHFFKVVLIIVSVILGHLLLFFLTKILLEYLSTKYIIFIHPASTAAIFASVCFCIFLFIVRKKILIWVIHLYQHYAPDQVRLRCLYTPSCSEYMILSIKKYGVIRGMWKGVKRLKRCHAPNGGEDYP